MELYPLANMDGPSEIDCKLQELQEAVEKEKEDIRQLNLQEPTNEKDEQQKQKSK